MRLWLVPLSNLSDQHLLGQHKEIHMLFGCLDNPRFKNHPQVKFYNDKRPWLGLHHKEIVDEMVYRFNTTHKSPVPQYSFGNIIFHPPADWIMYDVEDLTIRYQSRKGFYRWTNREPPKWVSYQTVELKDEIPLYKHVR